MQLQWQRHSCRAQHAFRVPHGGYAGAEYLFESRLKLCISLSHVQARIAAMAANDSDSDKKEESDDDW
jgi:hypothetical protein